MKTRQGFVSNSSTTSFTIYGISLHTGYSDKANKELAEEIDTALWELQKEGQFKSLETRYGEEQYTFYLGKDYDKLGEDETPRQFKAAAQEEIKQFLALANIDVTQTFSVHSESWYNG